MIIVGKRQSGKTTYAIDEVVRRYKDGDTIGVISYDYYSAIHLEKLLKAKLKAKLKDEAKVFGATKIIISLENVKDVDHVLIDNLDLILGDKCVCATSGGVVNVISDTSIDCEKVYKEVHNIKCKNIEEWKNEFLSNNPEYKEKLEKDIKDIEVEALADEIFDIVLEKLDKEKSERVTCENEGIEGNLSKDRDEISFTEMCKIFMNKLGLDLSNDDCITLIRKANDLEGIANSIRSYAKACENMRKYIK